jgi:hypothetical protein
MYMFFELNDKARQGRPRKYDLILLRYFTSR